MSAVPDGQAHSELSEGNESKSLSPRWWTVQGPQQVPVCLVRCRLNCVVASFGVPALIWGLHRVLAGSPCARTHSEKPVSPAQWDEEVVVINHPVYFLSLNWLDFGRQFE